MGRRHRVTARPTALLAGADRRRLRHSSSNSARSRLRDRPILDRTREARLGRRGRRRRPEGRRTRAQRARAANVTARFFEGDVADLEQAGVGDGFRLFLDAECFNHLNDDQRMAFGRGVNAVAGPDAEMLILMWRRAHRGPLPPGASRDDLTRSFPSWTIVDEFDYEAALPFPLKRIEPRWYLLART